MKFYSFSFKNDAIWSMIFTLAGLGVGVFVFLLVFLVRSLL